MFTALHSKTVDGVSNHPVQSLVLVLPAEPNFPIGDQRREGELEEHLVVEVFRTMLAYCSLFWKRMVLALCEMNHERSKVQMRVTIRLDRETYLTSLKGFMLSMDFFFAPIVFIRFVRLSR